ncbi:hypothetical protein [Hoeflea poritis]|uniref:Uncharacterized protein n=1 Tax=Hoeflea poritis TaxID=2993659 RepID=A0ABT4VP32_9HYPH|nr:hypothetical protein [Hoeflea poritis]MDA4846469.1 hypothetical protein [Hoeflea poritis]
MGIMNMATMSTNRLILTGIAVLFAALATGMAFAGWLNHGAEIFLTYASVGLAWCF